MRHAVQGFKDSGVRGFGRERRMCGCACLSRRSAIRGNSHNLRTILTENILPLSQLLFSLRLKPKTPDIQ
jgi:hypothetical protein